MPLHPPAAGSPHQTILYNIVEGVTVDNYGTTMTNSPTVDAFKFINHLNSRFTDHNDDYIINVSGIAANCNYYELEHLNNINTPVEHRPTHATLHINIHSLPAKHDQLQLITTRLNETGIEIDYILLCETFLSDYNQELYKIDGYQLVTRNRTTNSKGGVAIYIKNNISYKRRLDMEINVDGEFESIFVETNSNNNKLIIGEIYRIPNTNETESLSRYETILHKLNNQKYKTIIGTDQNFDYLKINKHQNSCMLLDHFLAAGLIPKITKPTRIVHSSATLIDNIYTNFDPQIPTKGSILITDISDHFPILLTYQHSSTQATTVKPLIIKSRKLNDTKIMEINERLKLINWNILNQPSIELSFTSFLDKINDIINQVAPEKEFVVKQKNVIRNPWITPGILKSANMLDKLFKIQKNKTPEHPSKEKYKIYKLHYNKVKRKSKHDYYSSILHDVKNDIRKTWAILNKLTGKSNDKSAIPNLFISNNTRITDPNTIANDFCSYFSKVGETFASEIPPSINNYQFYLKNNKNNNSLYLSPTDPEEVDKIITSMKSKKSSGPDGINSNFLKLTKLALKEPISSLINLTLVTGYVPKIM